MGPPPSEDPPPDERALTLELVGLFLVLPLAIAGLRWSGIPLPIVPLLVLGMVALWLVLQRLARRELSKWIEAPVPLAERLRVLAIFLVGASGMLGFVLWYLPDHLFDLPRRRPVEWGLVVLLYPFLSVLPQELFFRCFFFFRYGRLFRSRTTRIVVSGLLFGLAHVFYGNWIAVVFSALGGMLFAWTYARTRCLWWVTIEHAAYGMTLFTIGLGRYFSGGA